MLNVSVRISIRLFSLVLNGRKNACAFDPKAAGIFTFLFLHQDFNCFAQRCIFSHISGENHIRCQWKSAFLPCLPYRNSRLYLPKNICFPDRQRLCPHIAGCDPAFCDHKSRCDIQPANQRLNCISFLLPSNSQIC